ncbi:MAG: site-specific integrase [Bacteroidales bacterium]|nr:site-specific integrase [Bacteroidales bacterium]
MGTTPKIHSPNVAFFFQWMQQLISDLDTSKQLKTAQSYRNCMKSFSLFCDSTEAKHTSSRHLKLSQMTEDLIVNYQRFLLSKKVCFNTISFYMRILRAVYNKAVKSGLAEDRNLFSNVYTGVAKTEKRAVNADVIQQIKQLDLSYNPTLAFSRDLFLLSFYFRGMAFVDLSHLKKTNVQNDFVRYTRSKTKQDLRIKIEPCAKEILQRYSCKKTDYLLPILTSFENKLKNYDSALRLYNKHLSKLSQMTNLSFSLSSYVARHSWATLAKKHGVGLMIISESLGHNSLSTTQIYLDSLDQDRIDDANSLVISLID